MSRRLRRLLLRFLLVVLALLVLVLVAFTWFAFWPLEGSLETMTSIVPVDVDFVYRASWKGLEETGWIQENVLEHPAVPAIEEELCSVRSMLEKVTEVEDQINAQIPLGITTFSFEEDLLGGEIVAAGRFCEDWDPRRGVPRWRELLLLTRITWKPKFFSALKHGFVREQLGPDITVEDIGDGIFKFVLGWVVPSSVKERSACGPGIVMPPENVWYAMRVQDVLAISNAQALIRDVQQLADDPDSGRSYLDRPWVTLDAPPNAIAASLDLHPLEYYLVRLLEVTGPPITILQRYLTVTALDRMNGQLVLPSRDVVEGRAEIRYQPSQLGRGIHEVYALRPEPLGESVAALVPAEDTFGVLLLRTPPLHLIRAIYEEILGESDRQLWNENLRRMGRYENIEEFFEEFAERLGDTAGVAVARISDVYDDMHFPGFYLDPQEYPDPNWPALAMMVRLRSGTLPEELDEYLAERVPLLGGSPELEKVEYEGLTYTRIRLEVQSADYAMVQPAYILAQDHFIFCSNESYFRKILDTMVDPTGHPSLATDATFRSTMEHLPETAHLVFFLDFQKLLEVPSRGGEDSPPGGYLWDRRNIWVVQNCDPREEAISYRKELLEEHTRRTGRPATNQQRDAIEDRVEAHVNRHLMRYAEFEEEYRETLMGFGRLRSLGLGIRAERPALRTNLVVLLRPPSISGTVPPGGSGE